MAEPTDAELIAELEAAGVVFMAFRGGLSGTKELWTTSGSQDAKKIAAGMRAAIAKFGAPPEVSGEPVACGNCGGTGRMVRDPDIGTDQECFVCDGSGSYSEQATPQPTQAQTGAVPQCYQSGSLMSTPDGGMAAHLHFHGTDGVESWFDAITEALAAHGIKGGQHGADN